VFFSQQSQKSACGKSVLRLRSKERSLMSNRDEGGVSGRPVANLEVAFGAV
jgi:hypothetical protein